MSEARPQPYKVRAIHVVAKGADVLVREYTLDPGEAIPWHRHSEVSDETRNPPQRSTTYRTRARTLAAFCWPRVSANTIS